MTALPEVKIARSSADFSPAGLAGYTKAISAAVGLLGTVLLAISPFLPDDPTWTKVVGGAIAACGAIGVYFGKNNIEPVQVVNPPLPPPAPQPEEVVDDEPGKHEAQEPLLGVVQPPEVNPGGHRAEDH